MNTMVNQLLNIDNQARVIVDEAQQYYDSTLAELAAEKKKLMEEYEHKRLVHLEHVRHVENSAIEEAAAVIHAQLSTVLQAMQERYDQNHEQWEDALFSGCIGR